MKLCSFHALKALWDGQGKIKMYYGMPRVKKQLLGKNSISSKYLELVKNFLSNLHKKNFSCDDALDH